MTNGYLSQYFQAVAAKKLSTVEVSPAKSNQHEFNGSKELKSIFGLEHPIRFNTKFLWMEEQNAGLSEEGTVTWYDARANTLDRSEYRLYFQSNEVISMANEGDTLFIAKKTDGDLLIIIAVSGSTIENQLYWLFGLPVPERGRFEASEIGRNDHEVDFVTRFILDELGMEIEEPENDTLDSHLIRFDRKFPNTIVFSSFARETVKDRIDVVEDPDGALMAYMNWEEKLFRRLERQIVEDRLKEGFMVASEPDVEGFVNFSLSVQNRRKARAGHAFEDHISHILQQNHIKFSRKIETEYKAKPDFLFPGIEYYNNLDYPENLLTILGAKTSCKDRWRQILSEALRIKEKHLLTLEPGISENQTNEMMAHNIRLILPENIHRTYNESQKEWLLNVKEFIEIVSKRQPA